MRAPLVVLVAACASLSSAFAIGPTGTHPKSQVEQRFDTDPTAPVGRPPLANGGSGRVSAAAKQPVFFELLSEPLILYVNETADLSTIVDTSGYSSVGIYVGADTESARIRSLWRWNDDEDFAQVFDQRGGGDVPGVSACSGHPGARILCSSLGKSLRISLFADNSPATVTSVRVYLFP